MNIFITGGTTGIGYALACYYLDKGHRVGITGRDLNKLPVETTEKYSKLESFEVDVLDEEKMTSSIEKFSSNGSLDIIIANAGISDGRKPSTPDFKQGKKIIETNVVGVLNTFAPAVDIFFKEGKGQLVAISSVAAFSGIPGSSFYCASKSAVFRLCESLTIDLKPKKIAVTTICPGFIKTPLTDKNGHDMPFIIEADVAAAKIANAIEKKKALLLFPWQMAILITFLNKIPRSLYRYIMTLPFMNYSKEPS
jgi:short-subunit dehydrogenase